MSTVLLCLCGCPKGSHKQGKKACGQCGTCDLFELEGEVPTSRFAQGGVIRTDALPPPLTECINGMVGVGKDAACPCGDFPAGDPSDAHSTQHTAWLNRDAAPPLVVAINRATQGESTSAALRRVEQERDDLTQQLKASRSEGVQLSRRIYSLLKERDDALAELASARQELDQATARVLELASRVNELEALLEHAEQYARDLQDNGDVTASDEVKRLRARLAGGLAAGQAQAEQHARDLAAAEERIRVLEHGEAADDDLARAAAADVIDRQHRHLCEACGARYGHPYEDHEHGPLTPVTVLIIREQGAPPA